jgi:hypothetical protein
VRDDRAFAKGEIQENDPDEIRVADRHFSPILQVIERTDEKNQCKKNNQVYSIQYIFPFRIPLRKYIVSMRIIKYGLTNQEYPVIW